MADEIPLVATAPRGTAGDVTIGVKPTADHEAHQSSTSHWFFALVSVLVMVTLWVALAVLIQRLQAEYAFSRPFFITSAFRTALVVYIIPWVPLARHRVGGWLCWRAIFDAYPGDLRGMTIACLGFALAAYFYDLSWYQSSTRTTVGGNTVTYQTSIPVTWIASLVILKEPFLWRKLVAVLISFGGVVLITTSGSTTEAEGVHPEVMGYVWVLLSAITFALYDVAYKKFTAASMGHSVTLDLEIALFIVGAIGVLTGVLSPLLLWIASETGLESFSFPSGDQLDMFLVVAVMDATYTCLNIVCVAFSSPLFAIVGQTLVVPASIVVDSIANNAQLDFQAYVGVVLVLGSFVLLNAGFCFPRWTTSAQVYAVHTA